VRFATAQIAQAIADRLSPAIPEAANVSLSATGSALRVQDSRTSVVVGLSAFGDGETLSAQEAETATRGALSTIQDFVIEALTVPWPVPDASPDAIVRSGTLTAWFGSEASPALPLGL